MSLSWFPFRLHYNTRHSSSVKILLHGAGPHYNTVRPHLPDDRWGRPRIYFTMLYNIFSEFLEDITADVLPNDRTATAILNSLDFDFFEVLDSVTIPRSRRHITTSYDTSDIGTFPERLKPLSFHCPLTNRSDVIGFNEIFGHLSTLTLALYAPLSYVQPSRLSQYEDRRSQTCNLPV